MELTIRIFEKFPCLPNYQHARKYVDGNIHKFARPLLFKMCTHLANIMITSVSNCFSALAKKSHTPYHAPSRWLRSTYVANWTWSVGAIYYESLLRNFYSSLLLIFTSKIKLPWFCLFFNVRKICYFSDAPHFAKYTMHHLSNNLD